jgi:hypothetical protein
MIGEQRRAIAAHGIATNLDEQSLDRTGVVFLGG